MLAEYTKDKASSFKMFQNDTFGNVSTITIDGEPWLIGKEVAKVLGYSDVNKAIAMHVDNEDKLPFKLDDKNALSFQGVDLGQRGCWIINESGFYSLVLRSQLPSAKKFKHWITSEVLPSLIENGGYVVNQEEMSEVELFAKCHLLAEKVIAEREQRIKALQDENNTQKKLIEEMEPKSKYCDMILKTTETVSTSVIAKDYGLSAMALNQWLHDQGVQYKVGNTWLLYQKYANMGFTRSNTYVYRGVRDGREHTAISTQWTQKGRKFIYDLMVAHGTYPLMDLKNCRA